MVACFLSCQFSLQIKFYCLFPPCMYSRIILLLCMQYLNCQKTPQNLAFFLCYITSPSLQVNTTSIKSEYLFLFFFFLNPGLVRSGVMRCKKGVIQPDYPRTFCSNVSLCQHPPSVVDLPRPNPVLSQSVTVRCDPGFVLTL